jgi:hypothetical protein
MFVSPFCKPRKMIKHKEVATLHFREAGARMQELSL